MTCVRILSRNAWNPFFFCVNSCKIHKKVILSFLETTFLNEGLQKGVTHENAKDHRNEGSSHLRSRRKGFSQHQTGPYAQQRDAARLRSTVEAFFRGSRHISTAAPDRSVMHHAGLGETRCLPEMYAVKHQAYRAPAVMRKRSDRKDNTLMRGTLFRNGAVSSIQMGTSTSRASAWEINSATRKTPTVVRCVFMRKQPGSMTGVTKAANSSSAALV